jgi:hypothetical protein
MDAKVRLHYRTNRDDPPLGRMAGNLSNNDVAWPAQFEF